MTFQKPSFHPTRARDVLLALTCSLIAVVAVSRPAQAVTDKGGARSTLAITYPENSSTSIDLRGSLLRPGMLGKADVKRKDGRTRLKVHMDKLPHPQDVGSFYTTYVLWAVAPEGQAANLAELPHSKDIDIEVTTAFQTFGLVVTAEPHGAVSLPSPVTLAEGSARDDTRGRLQAGMLAYSSATGTRYVPGGPRDLESRDYATPLMLLGAHRAVEIARDAGATTYAESDLAQAEAKLASLDRVWPRGGRFPDNLAGDARDVMRLAEHARIASVEGADRARIAAERRAANAQVVRAETETARARSQVAQAQSEAERARLDAEALAAAAASERARAESARREAEMARAGEESARAQKEMAQADAQRAQQEADLARADKERMQQELFDKISAVLETRREARGMIVNLNDVLFDFDRATLTAAAREKLSRLSGILVAYPAAFRLDLEGHTDSIGAPSYNRELSMARASSVRDYLLGSGIPGHRMGSVNGFADERPVASNATPGGRQLNRRVEIVIVDLPS